MLAKTLILLCVASYYGTDAISAWTAPSALGSASGALTGISFAENQATGALSTTFTATATSGTVSYSTTGTPFSIDASTGVLSLDSALDYETTASYSLEVVAVDTGSNTGTATVPITVTDVNEAPTFAETSYQACAVEGSTEDTSITTATATDQDSGDVISYSIAGGDTNGELTFSSAVLQVATGETLASSSTATYTLTVHATDDDTPGLIGTATYTVSVVSDCSSATTLVVSIMTILMALVVSLCEFL